jgi:glutaminyl-peptide cyclotransferase
MLSAQVLPAQAVEQLKVEILREYPHDTSSYTQGLVWCGPVYYESTGQFGRSKLRKVRLEDGKVLLERPLEAQYFGEGLARVGNLLLQLTWMAGKAFVYDFRDFSLLRSHDYEGEGWGLTHDGTWLVMSDGSDILTFRDVESFGVWRKVPVRLNGQPVRLLNELEWVDGAVFANVWKSTTIVRIDPSSGQVTGLVDASVLPYRPRIAGEDVLNGIAYNEERKTFLLTGKSWPRLYEVRIR